MPHGAAILSAFLGLFGLGALLSVQRVRDVLAARAQALSPVWWVALGAVLVRFAGDVGALLTTGALALHVVAMLVTARIRRRERSIGFGRDVARHPGTAPKNVRRGLDAREEQRRSFAFGNVATSNPHVTREMIDDAAERLPAFAFVPPRELVRPIPPPPPHVDSPRAARPILPPPMRRAPDTRAGGKPIPETLFRATDVDWSEDATPTSPRGAA